ncbi:hypothetical protein K8942_03485 [Candidatus Peribacteria bacterium]|nr:MAG: hypothetical protein K8942_03485 [Candidatus Peribacteria bacterium]
MLQIVSILFGLATVSSVNSTVLQPIPVHEWVPQQHDRFIADTEANQGYIVHMNGSYTTFKIGSGQKKTLRYIGKTYNGATPEELWTVKSTTIQRDRGTFGKSGLFLRLYMDGEYETNYGIHATGNIDEILAEDDRYKSMGCVLVSDEVLEILAMTYALNDNTLEVATVKGLPVMANKSTLAKSL